MLIKHQIRNNFETTNLTTVTVGSSANTLNFLYKNITLPITNTFFPVDYGEDVQDIVLAERKKATNPAFDAETIKYLYSNSGSDLYLKFRFWNTTASTYGINYENADIPTFDILKNKNGFKKSFFRLYFYDSSSGETNNLIFTEDLDVDYTTKPEIKFNRLYWLRNDDYFIKNNKNRTVYMEARFFNAKTGIVKKFINIPTSFVNSGSGAPIDIATYSNPSNHGWRYSPIEIKNPKLNNGEYNFMPVPLVGANTSTVITLSEFIIK